MRITSRITEKVTFVQSKPCTVNIFVLTTLLPFDVQLNIEKRLLPLRSVIYILALDVGLEDKCEGKKEDSANVACSRIATAISFKQKHRILGSELQGLHVPDNHLKPDPKQRKSYTAVK